MTLSRTRSWGLALVVVFLGLAILGGGALSVPVAAEGGSGDDLSLSPQVRGFSELDFPVQDNNDPPVISDNPPVHSKSFSVTIVDPPRPDTPRTAASHQGTGSSDHSCDESPRTAPYGSGAVIVLPDCLEVRLGGQTKRVSFITSDRTTLHDYYRFECQRLGYGNVGSCADEKLDERQQDCEDADYLSRQDEIAQQQLCPANANWR